LAQLGQFFRNEGGRAVRLAKATLIASAKTAIDVALTRDRAWISFESFDHRRYYVYLLHALTRIGPVGCSARDAQRACVWLSPGEFIRSVRVNWRPPSNGFLLSEGASGPGILQINPRYYSSPPASDRLFAPYFAHPEFYKAGLHKNVRGMRGRERKVRVFFAGTLSGSAYSEEFPFPILTRDKIFNHILTRFERDIRSGSGGGGSRPIVIVSTGDTRDVIEKHELSPSAYLEAMSRADFFICPPGYRMPHSHNLIEAMSVGTIPITNYHSYMRPALAPDENCVAFSTIAELERVVDRALCMAEGEIRRLRAGVISYYEQNLEPESFGKKLMGRAATISELVVNDESGR
jgi:hypothetical protein